MGVNSCSPASMQTEILRPNSLGGRGFGSCHSGWLLAYDAHSLSQVGVFNVSPNLFHNFAADAGGKQ